MTPVHKTPSHNDNERVSIVFDAVETGKEIARFYGESHRQNANEFCRHFHGYKQDGSAA